MKNEANKSLQITLLHSEELLTGNKAANHFISQYAETGNLQVPAERTKEIRETQDTYRGNQGPFTCKELEDALSSLKQKKSPGPDQITNEMSQHLGPKAKKKLIQLFSKSWRTGMVPQGWREAIMIPVHKKGKGQNQG